MMMGTSGVRDADDTLKLESVIICIDTLVVDLTEVEFDERFFFRKEICREY